MDQLVRPCAIAGMSNKSTIAQPPISVPKGGGAVKGIGDTFQIEPLPQGVLRLITAVIARRKEIRLAGWSRKLCPRLCPNGCLLSTNTVTYGETSRNIFPVLSR
jgi:hypothetical protein